MVKVCCCSPSGEAGKARLSIVLLVTIGVSVRALEVRDAVVSAERGRLALLRHWLLFNISVVPEEATDKLGHMK